MLKDKPYKQILIFWLYGIIIAVKKNNLLGNSLVGAGSTFVAFILLFSYVGYKLYQINDNIIYIIVFFFLGFFCGMYFIIKELRKNE